MTAGFISLTIAETQHFLDAADILTSVHLPITYIDLSHIVLFVMLILFGIGVLSAN